LKNDFFATEKTEGTENGIGECKLQNVNCKMQNEEVDVFILSVLVCVLQFRLCGLRVFVVNELMREIMKTPSVFLLVFCWLMLSAGAGIAGEPKLLSQDLLDQGWISLFDGESLYGWQPTGDAKWEAVDGEIRTDGSKPGFLMSTTEWGDYDLHVEFKSDERTNSGVFLRTPLRPSDPKKDCLELNIAPADNPFPTGSFVGREKSSLPGNEFPAADTWHSFDLSAMQHAYKVMLDGKQVLGFDGAKELRIGHIGLQSREGKVAFRNVRLKPLHLHSIFNAKDLVGWNQTRAEKCQFSVTENGELHLTNGPGQIETDDEFKNFVLQIQCKVNGDGLNSGVFFRTLREGRWAGYESQINNKFKDLDRTKPADFGTGAVYRRQPARYVVPNDREWFTKTIVADGPHMAVWVNGYQVSDFTDTRPPKESAREGVRLGGGAIALQGHDATTDFSFRSISIAELPRGESQ
jgi:hypothetical protein